jgi:hypothetical protein
MVDAYKKYDLFLNVNSVKYSPTMFSRRVLELLACGTAVVSNYSLAIERLLGGDNVALVKSEAEAARWMDDLLNKPELTERMVHRGRRRVFSEHTYEQRLRFILDKIGIAVPPAARRVSVIACAADPAELDRLIAGYDRQAYADKELVLVVTGEGLDVEQAAQRVGSRPDVRVIPAAGSPAVGAMLNQAVAQSRFEQVAWFSAGAFYGEHFLTDLMAGFAYTDAQLVGKCAHFEYLDAEHRLILKAPDEEQQFVSSLPSSGMIVKRAVFERVRFPDGPIADETRALPDWSEKGFKMYSADRFNYVLHRATPAGAPAGGNNNGEHQEPCRVVADTDDYHAHVTV